MTTINDVMTPNPFVVGPSATVEEMAALIDRHKLRHLPVVSDLGRVTGLVTDEAVFRHGGHIGTEAMRLFVLFRDEDAEVTATHLAEEWDVVARTNAPLLGVLEEMLSTSQDAVLVLDDDDHVAGIFTEHDALRVASRRLPKSARVTAGTAGDVHTVLTHQPASEALALMQELGIRHLLVMEEDQTLAGVLSWRDLALDQVADARPLTAGETLATWSPITIREGSELQVAVQTMLDHHIGCLPVLDDAGRPIGVLTRTDAVTVLVALLA